MILTTAKHRTLLAKTFPSSAKAPWAKATLGTRHSQWSNQLNNKEEPLELEFELCFRYSFPFQFSSISTVHTSAHNSTKDCRLIGHPFRRLSVSGQQSVSSKHQDAPQRHRLYHCPNWKAICTLEGSTSSCGDSPLSIYSFPSKSKL